MTIRSKQYLKTKFLTGAKPTQDDYHDLIESVVNQEEAASFGLGEYNPTALYKAGAGTLRLGKIYQALEDVSGTFNPLKWRDITSQVLSTGFPIWTSGESVPVNAYRERNSRLFKSLQNGNTGNDPVLDNLASPVWWQEISASSSAFGKYWQNGLYFKNDVVRFFDAGSGRVRLLEMTQASLISSDVPTELQEGKWRDVGGTGDAGPGVGSGTAETTDYTPADSDNLGGFWKTLLTAGKLKVSAALDRVASNIGLLGGLTTTNKGSLVAAINEVNAKPTGINSSGAVIKKGTFNATTGNVTDLVTGAVSVIPTAAPGNKGWFWVVATTGTYSGVAYAISDWIVSDGNSFNKVNNTDSVTSVYSKVGAIVPTKSDIEASLALTGTSNRAIVANPGGQLLEYEVLNRVITDTTTISTLTNEGNWVGDICIAAGAEAQLYIGDEYRYDCILTGGQGTGKWTRYPTNKKYVDVFVENSYTAFPTLAQLNSDFPVSDIGQQLKVTVGGVLRVYEKNAVNSWFYYSTTFVS